MTALIFWVLLVASGPTVIPQTAVPIQGENVPFEVCEQSFFWTRPSEEVQQKIWKDPRYQGLDRNSYDWAHYFFFGFDDGSASGEYHQKNTGLWTAEDAQHLCGPIGTEEQVELWILLHKVEAVERQGTVYTVMLQPTEKGFQIIRLPRSPAPRKNLTFIFVTSAGKEIDRIVEGLTPGTWDHERESVSGGFVAISGDQITVNTVQGVKAIIVTSKTSVDMGGFVALEVLEPGDMVSAIGLPQPDGTISADKVYVSNIKLSGILESSSPGRVVLALTPNFLLPVRGPRFEVGIGRDTIINDGKGSPEDIQVGSHLRVEGVRQRGQSVRAVRIWTY